MFVRNHFISFFKINYKNSSKKKKPILFKQLLTDFTT